MDKVLQTVVHIPTSCLFCNQLPDKHGITALLASIYESKTDCVGLLIEKVRIYALFVVAHCGQTD